ncbi:MAG: DNA methyltransferase [Pseudomonadota bacterium]
MKDQTETRGPGEMRYVPIDALKPYANNPRTHSKKQIRQIAKSIEEFGWTNPILVDPEGGVIAGHGRLEAAKHLSLERVPVLPIEHMSEAQKRAYVIADNKLAENAGWDADLLKIELGALLEFDIDVTMSGFEMGEIDVILSMGKDDADRRDDIVAPDPGRAPVTALGDLWQLGEHRIFCGDATKPESWATLMGSERAQLVFTDPPYNVKIDGHVSGLGDVKHREFAMAAGEMSAIEFTEFLTEVCGNLAKISADGAIHFVCMDWAHLYELLAAGREVYDDLKNICVWTKTNGGMGSLYRSQHEMVAVFKSGTAPHINNVELGRFGRYRTNVWSYPGMNSFGAERDEGLSMHPTVKPVALVEDAILDCSNRGGIVVDAFLGSGTTLIAADAAGRRCYAMELDPLYVDLAIERWQKQTGEEAMHVVSGLGFDELC